MLANRQMDMKKKREKKRRKGCEKGEGEGAGEREMKREVNIQRIDKFPEILLSFDSIMCVSVCLCVLTAKQSKH